jgi:hypothetical protein
VKNPNICICQTFECRDLEPLEPQQPPTSPNTPLNTPHRRIHHTTLDASIHHRFPLNTTSAITVRASSTSLLSSLSQTSSRLRARCTAYPGSRTSTTTPERPRATSPTAHHHGRHNTPRLYKRVRELVDKDNARFTRY